MRLLRNKRNRKTLEFFRLVFGARPPYKVLVDGNFVAQAATMQQADAFERLVQQLLGDTTFLHVTDCIVAELAALGAPAARALAAARTLSTIRCRHKHGHAVGMDPAACLAALVGATNASHYIVATQDVALRAAMRAVPGTPVLLYSKNVLVLEPPSAASRSASGSAEVAKAGVSAEEAAAVRAAKRALRAQAEEAARAAAAAGGQVADGAGLRGGAGGGIAYSPALPGPLLAGGKRRRGSGGGLSGPNPLSIKKKPHAAAAAAAGGPAGSGRPPAPVPSVAPSATVASPAAGAGAAVGEAAEEPGTGAGAKRSRNHHRKRGGSGVHAAVAGEP